MGYGAGTSTGDRSANCKAGPLPPASLSPAGIKEKLFLLPVRGCVVGSICSMAVPDSCAAGGRAAVVLPATDGAFGTLSAELG